MTKAGDDDGFSEFLRTDPPPDLQELIRKYGGYGKITPEAWAQWDRDNAAWQERRRARLIWTGRK